MLAQMLSSTPAMDSFNLLRHSIGTKARVRTKVFHPGRRRFSRMGVSGSVKQVVHDVDGRLSELYT
jgi:hypothetical protein